MQVTDLDLASTDGGYQVSLVAVAPTLGYTDVNLSAVVYVQPPLDGIQDLILSYRPPSGLLVPQVIHLIPLKLDLPPVDWFRGVRVHVEPGLIGEPMPITLRSLVLDHPPVGDDTVMMSRAGLRDDTLVIDATYGGGCAPHHFQLAWDGLYLESHPPAVVFTLSHNANGDDCRMLINEQLEFDLSTVTSLDLSTVGRALVQAEGGITITVPLPAPPLVGS
ncbi:MAG: hypothetical protein AAGI54_09850 [Planctomycetota bacterium]